MLRKCINALFPPKCVLCGKILEKDETDLCRACWADQPEYSQEKLNVQFLDSFAAVWYYERCVRRSLLRYKFHGARHYAPVYGRLMAMRVLRECPEAPEVVTWVPVSALRRFRRGYDQVELLARAVAKELGVPCVRLLKKVRHNPPQSGISGHPERRANVLGVYRCADVAYTKNKRILLLDDILTTGATAGECARVLLSAGGSQVHCAVVAAARRQK